MSTEKPKAQPQDQQPPESPDKAARKVSLIDIDINDTKTMDKRIWGLALPALIEMMMMSLFNMVDMIMVGSVGTVALAAVGIATQPVMLAGAIFQSTNTGAMTLVARFTGTKDYDSRRKVLQHALLMALFFGTIVSITGVFLAEKAVVFMGAEPEVIGPATSYFAISAAGAFFMASVFGIGATLRGAGDTTTPMKYNLTANFLNVIGNYVLIYGKFGFPQMGVAGAALSTTISRGIAMIMALYAVYRPGSVFSLSTHKGFKLDFDIVKRILRIGIPSGLEQLVMRTGQIEFTRTVAQSLGTTVFASHQIGMNLMMFTFSPSMSFGMAATSLVGQNLGAGRPDAAEKFGLRTRRQGMMVAIFIGVIYFFFGRQVAGLYTKEAEVAMLTASALKILAVMQPLQSTQFILSGALRGAGDTRWPLYGTLIGIWGIRVVAAKIFIGMGYGLLGAWGANFLDQLFRSTFIYLRYNSNRWKTVKV